MDGFPPGSESNYDGKGSDKYPCFRSRNMTNQLFVTIINKYGPSPHHDHSSLSSIINHPITLSPPISGNISSQKT